MNLCELVEFIKLSGCRIRLYRKEKISSSDCAATFNVTSQGPLISVALYSVQPNQLVPLILHEFAHYWQWKCGLISAIDSVIDGWKVFENYISGKQYSKDILDRAMIATILLEYDAEIKTLLIAKKLKISLNREEYLMDAAGYAQMIARSFRNKKWYGEYQRSQIKKKMAPRELIETIKKGPN